MRSFAVLPESLPALNNVLNIYGLYEDGLFKVAFETIETTENKSTTGMMFPDGAHSPQIISELYLDALCKGEIKKYRVSLCLLDIPINHIATAMELLTIFNEALRSAEKYYDTILFSTGSVLSCYDEILLTWQPLYQNSLVKYKQAVNDLPISLEHFIYLPQHTMCLNEMRSRLMTRMLAIPKAPGYEALQAFIRRYGSKSMDDLFLRPIGCMEAQHQFNFYYLLDTSVPYNQREKHAEEIACRMLAELDPYAGQFFLDKFHDLAKGSLVSECCSKRASNGGIYHSLSPEMLFLLHAEFKLLPDGRMCMVVADNPAYLHSYAPDKDQHVECELDFKHWAESLDLAFDQDSDFHRCMIFTADSSRKLKARGLHFSSSFWDDEMLRAENVTILQAQELRFFKTSKKQDDALLEKSPGYLC